MSYLDMPVFFLLFFVFIFVVHDRKELRIGNKVDNPNEPAVVV
jgi:hypothetical protein